MSPPPATATQTSGGTMSAEAAGQTERLIRAAHAVLDHVGYELSPSKVARLVRKFETTVARNGWAFFDYLANAIRLDADQRRTARLDPGIARVIAYADPTGEAAVSHVLEQRGY